MIKAKLPYAKPWPAWSSTRLGPLLLNRQKETNEDVTSGDFGCVLYAVDDVGMIYNPTLYGTLSIT